MKRKIKSQTGRNTGVALLIGLSVLVCIGLFICGIFNVFFSDSGTPTPVAGSGTLDLAYSPEKDTLMQDIVNRFNRAGYRTPAGQAMTIKATKMEASDIVDAARAGTVTAISPDSSLWLGQIDAGRDVPLVSESTRFAVTPVVVAMWNDTAQSLGYPSKQIGWQDLLTKAKGDPNFRWSHPSTSSASGLLATLAEFYAGAGKTRALTEEDVKAKATLDYVGALEKTVRYYGE